MTTRIIGTCEEWLAARLRLFKEEKELTRRSDELDTQRQTAGGAAASRNAAALGAADLLSLAAAPTFAIMALLTGVLGGGPLDVLCSAAPDASPLTGMLPMYLLMSAFHSAPWLKLISSRRSDACGSSSWVTHSAQSTESNPPEHAVERDAWE